MSHDQLGDLPNAEAAYKTLIAINPNHKTAYNNLGNVFRKVGRTDEAIASYRKQIEVEPRNRFASWNLSTGFGVARPVGRSAPVRRHGR